MILNSGFLGAQGGNLVARCEFFGSIIIATNNNRSGKHIVDLDGKYKLVLICPVLSSLGSNFCETEYNGTGNNSYTFCVSPGSPYSGIGFPVRSKNNDYSLANAEVSLSSDGTQLFIDWTTNITPGYNSYVCFSLIGFE